MDPRLVIRDPLALRLPSTEPAGSQRWSRVAVALILSCSACQGSAIDAAYPEACPKEPRPDDALAGEPSHERAPLDVIPALPPREEPPPPNDTAALDDYPPPDRIPAVPESAAPPALRPADDTTPVIPALPTVLLPTGQALRLLAIDPKRSPYKVNVPREYVACGEEYVSHIRICVSEEGFVSSMRLLQGSIPLIDLQLARVILRWRYHPYRVDGRATAFCYPMNYRVR